MKISKHMSIKRFWHWEVEQRWIRSRFNPKAIRPGDIYENCNYHPMLCISNHYGDLTGVSLVDGSVGSCSAFHCGPFKMTVLEAMIAKKNIELEKGMEQIDVE